jgi:putative nucleotidyltransferase with HDIG domain
MDNSRRLQSLFSQKLDRAVFGTYFLGAVVPLLALAAVVHRFVLPTLEQGSDRYAMLGMIGFILAVGLLSLAAFFALRRLTHGALNKMDSDNARLSTILRASRDLSSALHMHAAADTAAGCGLALTDSDAVYLLLQTAPGKKMTLCESSGESAAALYDKFSQPIGELLEASLAKGSPSQVDSGKTRGSGTGVLRAAAVVPFSLAKGAQGAFVMLRTKKAESFDIGEIDAIQTLAGFTSIAFQNAELQDSQRNFYSHATEILVAALDAQLDRSDGRVGHQGRIAAVANRLGRELGVDEESLQRLHFGALLHDIGYLKIGRTRTHDSAQCRAHPVLGHRMLSRIRLWEDVAPIVLYHHEWYDGSGYPEQKVGEEIPLEARIIAVADSLDKLTHENSDRPLATMADAMVFLRAQKELQFDPAVVDALDALVERGDLSV